MAAGGAEAAGFVAKEVLRDVGVGPESRVKGTEVQRALGTVRAQGTRWKRTAGLPPGGGGGGLAVTQDGEDRVVPLGWGGRHRGGRGV